MSRTRRAAIFAAIFSCTVAFDQGSKVWARGLPMGVSRPVISGYWDWELAKNTGTAFSLAGGVAVQIVLGLIAAIALVAIGIAAARTRPDERLRRAAFAMIAGGALGNLVDRIRDGAVTDFVRWHIHAHMWPVFNVADVALVIGVACLVLDEMFRRRRAAT